MRIWLGALDERLVKVMDTVERNLKEDKAVAMGDLTGEGRDASRKLYSILFSYTKRILQRKMEWKPIVY